MFSICCICNRSNMIEILFWSIVVITWASYGMHVLKEFIRNHSGDYNE